MIREYEQSKPEIELLKIGEKESFEFNLPSVEFNELFYEIRFKDFSSKDYRVLFLWKEKKPIAYIALDLKRGNGYANITSIFVLKKYRKKGYATKLIRKSLSAKSIEKITLQVYSHNEASLKLYNKLGFNVISYNMEYKNDS